MEPGRCHAGRSAASAVSYPSGTGRRGLAVQWFSSHLMVVTKIFRGYERSTDLLVGPPVGSFTFSWRRFMPSGRYHRRRARSRQQPDLRLRP